MESEQTLILSGLITLSLLAGLYFAPAIVARSRGHRNTTAILVLDLFLGWTLIGWVVAMVWAVTSSPRVATAGGESITPETHVICPDCREYIRHDAMKCRYCGCKLIPQ